MSRRFGGLTIRSRLALLNSGVFVAGGGAILALVWFSVLDIIGNHSGTITQSEPATAIRGLPPATPTQFLETVEPTPAVSPKAFYRFQDEVMADLLRRSLIILVAVAVLCVLANWWVARRSLSRIGRVTTTARHIGDENLHARLALVGPKDEVKELADTFDAMLDRLERSFADQRHFTAHASHELRTPSPSSARPWKSPSPRAACPPLSHPTSAGPSPRPSAASA